MSPIRRHLTFANVVSCLALFVALGGASYAAVNPPKNSVGSRELQPRAVKTGYLDRNAVRVGKLAPEAARAGKIAKRAITTDRLRDGAVTAAKVRDGSLLAGDFAPGQLPAGTQGPAGPPGPQGSPGATSVVVRTNSSTVSSGGTGQFAATCFADEVATGGGVGFINHGAKYLLMLSEPRAQGGASAKEGEVPKQWYGKARNDAGSSNTMVVYAICASP